MEPKISCLIFITNCIACYVYEKYIYSFLFCLLTLTSLLFHSMPNLCTNIIDKCAIGMVVFYGGYVLYPKIKENYVKSLFIVSTFIAVLVLFFYGYCTNTLCYDPNVGNHFHCLLHGISSVGHHCILFL